MTLRIPLRPRFLAPLALWSAGLGPVALAAEPPLFVELRLEVSGAPFHSLPRELLGTRETAYALRPADAGSAPRLYPLQGSALPPDDDPPPLWIGLRAARSGVEGAAERGVLIHSALESCEVASLPGLPPELFFPVTVRRTAGRTVAVTAEGKEMIAEPGLVGVVASKQLRISLEDLAGHLAPGSGETRESILARLEDAHPSGTPVELWLRLLARNHGPVAVAPFDARLEWEHAQEAMAEGDYRKSLTHVDRVLEALPSHQGARHLKEQLEPMAEAGVRGVSVMVRLTFPPGSPTRAHKDLWQTFNPGSARLVGADHEWSAPVREGAIQLAAPPGAYRLEVTVPGFSPVVTEVTLEAPALNLTVPLR